MRTVPDCWYVTLLLKAASQNVVVIKSITPFCVYDHLSGVYLRYKLNE